MDVDAPATQDLTRQPHLHRKRPKPCPAAAAPRTRRCPMPGADPQTETTAITQGHLHTMLNPGLQRRSLNTRVIRVTPEIWSCPRREHGSVRKGPANAGTSRHGLPNLWMPGPEDPLVVADDLYCPLRARTGDGQTLAADHDIGVNGRAVEPDLIPILVAHRQTVDHREREALSPRNVAGSVLVEQHVMEEEAGLRDPRVPVNERDLTEAAGALVGVKLSTH